MRILLLSMPDSFEHTPTVAIRMPNGALASLAGNVDRHHQVAIADLILAQRSVRATVERLMAELDPDVVGLSVMTFQRSTARRVIGLIRALKPTVRIVVGGYDPSLAPEAWTHPDAGADVIFGSHSHRLQPMDTYEGKPVFYGLGNFVWPRFSAEGSRSAVAEVVVRPDGDIVGRLLPATIVSDGHPVLT